MKLLMMGLLAAAGAFADDSLTKRSPDNIGKASAPPYNPHPVETDYTEDYRPQFHFSPKSEWMNDVNALIYHDGVYHMIYQWGKAKRHGGYATSTDLIHWEDSGVALVPRANLLPDAVQNASGNQIYSGSGVFVDGEAAARITGEAKPTLVTLYTGTRVGTCIAWSNDEGATWHNYAHNPVANPTKGGEPRDPCVFWYEPTKSWIMAIYEKGTGFYGSTDLINWDFLSHIDFGYECPDVFELPLDGDLSQMKWVLQDANGSYLVGQFDGATFHSEQDRLIMDKGPDFYAAQTFFRQNLPGNKVIQIAWNDHWNGGAGERGWQRNATFPVEMGLVTYDGKMQVTRTPIDALRKLYTDSTKFTNKTLKPGRNVLSEFHSKAFDMTAEFDLSRTTAEIIQFVIANKTYTYDISAQTLSGKKWTGKTGLLDHEFPLKPDADGRLKIRMLVDWANVEIFGNEGVFSYSQHLKLNPKSDKVAINVDGDVQLVSLEFNPVKSIWKKDK